uniref:Phosphoinositide phospholipase C n=1 Tax=Timema tahoe TaxID=61484 RepID=A0A7R9IQT3_9NEOP|nr:unnamed protein product [Timema tahoe]
MFDEAATDSSGCLDERTAISLIQKLSGSGHITTVRIKQKLAEFDQTKLDGRRGTIDSKEFIDMFKEVATRPEIYFLLIRFANKDYLTAEDLQLFLECEQGMSNLTREKCLDIINRFEPTSEARMNGQLLIDGFTKYLLSEECDIFDPIHREVCQDMRQPLTHYTVSASHNTYLLEDQLKGPSSVEGYIRALGNGCRCVKGELLLRTYHEQNNHRSDEVYPHLCGRRMEKLFVKTTLSTSNRDSNLKFPVIGSLIYCESSALGRAPTEMARVWCGGDVALVWRVV